jgi:futalosine hydrolase
MNILIVSATATELAPFLERLGYATSDKVMSSFVYKNHRLGILVTGVGMTQTAYYLGKFLSAKYDVVINAGICGSFDKYLRLGETVIVKEDYFADLGAEDGEKFLSIHELNLPGAYYVKNEKPLMLSVLEDVKQVRGVTVNTTHGNTTSIQKFNTRIKADVETMEGAAFLWACNQEKVRCLQLRSISNYVEKRDRSKWEIPAAIKSLNEMLTTILDSL